MIKRAFQDITNLRSKNIKLTIHKSSHRKKLFRWLREVCNDFDYSNYTYVTSLIIIDSFTEKNSFDLDDYQLIGITSLFIAAKIEEKQTKSIKDYSLVTDNTYSSIEIKNKEIDILSTLDYSIQYTLPQAHFNYDYISSIHQDYSLDEKIEILNCIIFAFMERRSCTKNMKLLYLEALKDMKMFLNNEKSSADVAFYIKKNSFLEKLNK